MARAHLLYFAWLREHIGRGEETLELPAAASTVGGLIAFLMARGEGYQAAFAQPDLIRAAVNQTMAEPSTPIAAGDEVAFFPPITGG